jgi:signal peptidase I
MRDTVIVKALIETLRAGEAIEIPVEGKSMHPTLRTGDIVRVEPLVNNEYFRIGDIVVFDSRDGRLVIHRIIEILRTRSQLMIITKGDTKLSRDTPLPANDFPGRVTFIRRQPGLVFMNTPLKRWQAYFIAKLSSLCPNILSMFLVRFRLTLEGNLYWGLRRRNIYSTTII